MALLTINDLIIKFKTNDGLLTAVNGFNCVVEQGQTLGIVGESGSGKSQTVLSIMRLLANNAIATGEILFEQQDLLKVTDRAIRGIRGQKIAMIFQDPMTCLNPYLKVGNQLMESLTIHKDISKSEAKKVVLNCMDAVKISDAKKRFNQYPHEFSGGMRQRIMISMALLCKPKLLIADEPTTALDVTVQAEIMNLLNELKQELDMTIILITHDLGVVAGNCDEVIVLYGGRIMEQGSVDDIFYNPSHPYTNGLLNSIPAFTNTNKKSAKKLFVIPGNPPSLFNIPKGCPFTERCDFKLDNCINDMPVLTKVKLNNCGSTEQQPNNLEHLKACHIELNEE